MEYVKGISLRDYYQRCHRRICEKACKRIFYQLCDAMSYLHSNHMALQKMRHNISFVVPLTTCLLI